MCYADQDTASSCSICTVLCHVSLEEAATTNLWLLKMPFWSIYVIVVRCNILFFKCYFIKYIIYYYYHQHYFLCAAGLHAVHASVQHPPSSCRVLCRTRLDKVIQPHLRCWCGLVLGVFCAVHDLCGVLCVLDASRPSRHQVWLQVRAHTIADAGCSFQK